MSNLTIDLKDCPLTGYPLNKDEANIRQVDSYIYYDFKPVGKVKILIPVLSELKEKRHIRVVLAGLCRNASEFNKSEPDITHEFLAKLSSQKYPKNLVEKGIHFLTFMYNKGEKGMRSYDFNEGVDFTICYCDLPEELETIIQNLLDRNFIIVGYKGKYGDYRNVRLTNKGIEEVEKKLPKIPMISLVNQEIFSGNPEVDEIINSARKLFFEDSQSMENMRSACEKLSFILEPLRNELLNNFQKKDVSDFFKIINEFDVRHNKSHTKNLNYPEQLEWIFYSLLNTINSYVKLKSRIK